MIGCNCLVCTSRNAHNRRLRPSALIQWKGQAFLIDAAPDLRMQALTHKISSLDGLLLTHTHYDHIGGIDDLRSFYLLHRKALPVLLSLPSFRDLERRFPYLFEEKKREKSLSAQLNFQILEQERGRTTFVGLPVRYFTYEQGGMKVNGYRFGNLAYVSDIKHFDSSIQKDLEGAEILILSALRHDPSPMHFTLEEAIEFSERAGAKRTYFTHIGHELEEGATNRILPKDMQLAYDGLKLEFEIDGA